MTELHKIDEEKYYKMKRVTIERYDKKTKKKIKKEYPPVNEKCSYFFSDPYYEGWSITSEVVHFNERYVVIRAIIYDSKGRVRATGHAHEDQKNKKSIVNETSFVENCETSAIGRALSFIGIGIDTSIASADEMKRAVSVHEAIRVFNETDKKIDNLCNTNSLYKEMVEQIEVTNTVDDLRLLYQKYNDEKNIDKNDILYLCQKQRERIESELKSLNVKGEL